MAESLVAGKVGKSQRQYLCGAQEDGLFIASTGSVPDCLTAFLHHGVGEESLQHHAALLGEGGRKGKDEFAPGPSNA